jgi:hypothetical protein
VSSWNYLTYSLQKVPSRAITSEEVVAMLPETVKLLVKDIKDRKLVPALRV